MHINISAIPPVAKLGLGFGPFILHLPLFTGPLPPNFCFSALSWLHNNIRSGVTNHMPGAASCNAISPPKPFLSQHPPLHHSALGFPHPHPHHQVFSTPTKRSLKMESHVQIKTLRKLTPWRGKHLLSGRWLVPKSCVWFHQTSEFLACVSRCAEHSRGTQQLFNSDGEEATNGKTKPSSCIKNKAGTQPWFQHMLPTSLEPIPSLGCHWVKKLYS